jgi:hypothetical protein
VEELIESVCRRKYKDRSFNIGVRNRIPEIFVKLEKIVDGKCEYHRSKDSKSGKRYVKRDELTEMVFKRFNITKYGNCFAVPGYFWFCMLPNCHIIIVLVVHWRRLKLSGPF